MNVAYIDTHIKSFALSKIQTHLELVKTKRKTQTFLRFLLQLLRKMHYSLTAERQLGNRSQGPEAAFQNTGKTHGCPNVSMYSEHSVTFLRFCHSDYASL